MRRSFLFLALLFTAKLSALAVDLGATTSRTPYDTYMKPVKQVFSSINGEAPSMNRVEKLMSQGRAFRYSHTEPFYPALPEVTAKRRLGDCKDKALWLCDQLQDPSARFVIGKMKRNSRINHAWVMWEHEGRWWILDCTMNWNPIPADRLGPNEYIPQYSFSKGTAFRHSGNSTQVAETAAKTRTPVATKTSRRIASN